MTRDETKAMLMLITSVYPRYYADLNDMQKRILIDQWHKSFEQVDSRIVRYALDSHISASKWPPTIADIRDRIDMMDDSEASVETLWDETLRLIRRGTRVTQDELDAASPEVRRWLRNPANVKELSQLPFETVQSVTRGQFMKQIDRVKEKERIRKEMPFDVHKLLEPTAIRFIGDFD